MNWVDWHQDYDTPGSPLHRRLGWVQRRIGEALDAAPPGPIRVLSMCAGQGRDLLGVLPGHPRRSDVRARLVELDPDNAAAARRAALPGVEVVTGDAGDSGAYDGVVPVHLAIVCGVFGNLTDADIRNTVAELPRLCAPGGTVVWTRHTERPDLTPDIRSWLAESGFQEVAFDTEPGFRFGVGTHRLTGAALPYRPDRRLFRFTQSQDR
ncbi:MAG TPA: class I SAM-dependent methyltransferase family protein [Actinophytocola sp.]|uniref:class I SAM-dependent methyltransferase family protein n=1 Tax=Actinophytocola sp. TaxID=1872138 RepID=UPI002DBF0044|nr:class I SAM-dependent methyltransferase family protein [Actinophytocola sp.]HEU5470133.1 class I SAM-dependent methyltransferase family protein [Actinophytocola sp.]